MRNREQTRNSIAALLVGLSLLAHVTTSLAMPDKRGPGPGAARVTAAFPGQASPLANASGPNTPATAQQIGQWIHAHLQAHQAVQQASAATVAVPRDARVAAVKRLNATAGKKVKLVYHQNGTPSHISGGVLEPAAVRTLARSMDRHEETAKNFLRVNRELLLLEDPDQELKLLKSEKDELGRRHLLFQQTYQGVPVWPCCLTVHQDPGGKVDVMDGAYVPTPRNLETIPFLTAEEAAQRGRNHAAQGAGAEVTPPELVIYAPLEQAPRLAWKYNLTEDLLHAWRYVVDARDGSILSVHSLVEQEAVTGSGTDGAGATRTLHVWHQGTKYYMVDTSKPMYNPASTPPTITNTFGAILVLDAANQPPTSSPTSIGGSLAASTSATSGWVPDAVGAAFGLSETFDYYQARHSRNSLDGEGGSITAFVRVGVNYPNAAWIGQAKVMIFGDGYPNGLDVCGHELTHGVVNTIANGQGLASGNQPGALNEAIADIFGESIEARTRGTNDWLMGEDIPIGAIRNLADPPKIAQGGRPSPSTMSQFVELPDTAQGDYGGVHLNSTIISHCFYLLVQGMQAPISRLDGERIFYRALTVHMQPQTQFIDARHACVTAAEELFGVGSTQAVKTGQTFDAVELADAPATHDPPSIPPVSGADSALFLRWDSFFSEYDIYRCETAAGDTASGTYLFTTKAPDYKRITVSGDGSFALFVAADHDYGTFNTDGTGVAFAGQPGTLWSMAMTPDSKHFAGVLLDGADNPTKNLFVYDDTTSSSKVIPLSAPANDGTPLDIIKYADTMDFTSDGKLLIYDAYSEIPTTNGTFGAWTLYALNLATTNITQLLTLNARYDFGNPSIAKTRNNVLTFEVRDNQTGISSYHTLDLFSGELGLVGQNPHAGALGFPEYTGDDHAIICSEYDASVDTGSSLYRQPLAADGLNMNGPAALWIADADLVSTYRRGTFVASNALPVVTITAPTEGRVFAPSAPIDIRATASDPDDSIAAVEFYLGSTKLITLTNAPFEVTITSGLPAGQYHLSARAIDVLGGATDSKQVAITVAAATGPRISNPVRRDANTLQFTVSGNPGASYLIQTSSDLINWSLFGTVTNATGTVNVQDTTISNQPRRFYRALLK